ncbi:MAG: chemotaxis protein CheR [Hyphomicrobiales bacterium]|nr:MAG: chemotaxis protein CheR [Hyphomicrobiales bacterium]
MKPETFERISTLVKSCSGIVLTKEKEYLLESRLEPVARRHGMNNIDDIAAALSRSAIGRLADDVVEAMTTNETFFFRDRTPFTHFSEVMLPYIKQARSNERKLRIWCAAASMGQEPYSLAMLLQEDASMRGWRREILGTDISVEALEKAKSGMYSQFEVQRGLPVNLLVKYFKQHGDVWQISPEIRSAVQYRQYNLLKPFTGFGKFDVVFCRNVLIYFDQQTKKDILERIAKQMNADSYLVLGAAETVIGLTDTFSPVPGKRGLFAVNAQASGQEPQRRAMTGTDGLQPRAPLAAGGSSRPAAPAATRAALSPAGARPGLNARPGGLRPKL